MAVYFEDYRRKANKIEDSRKQHLRKLDSDSRTAGILLDVRPAPGLGHPQQVAVGVVPL